MTDNEKPQVKLPRSVCMGWGLGTLGPVTVLTATNVLLLRYLTDYVGIAAALAATLIAASKIFDGFTDPLMGWISDRTKTKIGRRRPYLLFGGVLLAISVVGLFAIPDIEDYNMRAAYVGGMLLFYALAYTVFNIPYLAMPAEMTNDYHERSYLMSFRVYGVGFSTIAASVLGPMLLAELGGGKEAYFWMSLVFVPLVIISSWYCYHATRSAPFTEHETVEKVKFSFKEQISSVVSNKPFMLLLLIKFLILMSLGIKAVFAFFFAYVLELSDSYLGQYFLFNSLGMILSQPLWLRVVQWTGSKRNTFMIALAISVPVYLSWLLAAPTDPAAYIYIRAVLVGISGGGAILMGQSLLPDTMEYDYRRTGLRREGIFAGFYTTVEKLSGAIGVAVVGMMLSAAGYIQSQGIAVEQPESAIKAIYLIMGFLPTAISVSGIICLMFYSLTEEKLKATGLMSEEDQKPNS